MNLINLKVKEFINEVDSLTPTPGGGSSSALMSSLGISLSRMVGHLTVGKKRFSKFDEKIQEEFINTINNLEEIKNKLISLIDEDTNAYNEVVKAFKLPKETSEEISKRELEIEKATIKAIEVPLEILSLSYQAIKTLNIVLKVGNPNAISDLGVSVLSLSAGAEGALLNVLINLPGLSNEELKVTYSDKANKMIKEVKELKEEILNGVYHILNK